MTWTAAGVAAIYTGDYAVAHLRRDPYSDVTVYRYTAIPQKFNRMEYDPASVVTERCVKALFPHSGHNPCWYLKRHKAQFVSPG